MNTDWRYAWSKPQVTGELKATAQDFYVEEELGFEPEGLGEHLYLFIEKQGVNTEFLARLIAKHVDLGANKVTYSGLKDRHAVTRQWFCLHVLNQQLDGPALMAAMSAELGEDESIKLVKMERHPRKLKVGVHKTNRFVLRIRQLTGNLDDLKDRLALVALEGVPNYFGPQRFGINGNNLVQGRQWLARSPSPKKRLTKTESFWLSAIRSWFFNQALSDQVASGLWGQVFIDDRVQLQGTQSAFKVDEIDASLLRRLHQLDLHPQLPLVNTGALGDTSMIRAHSMSQSWQEDEELLAQLNRLSLGREQRVTRVIPENMVWELLNDQLIVQFSLPKGSFATSVLRELIDFTDASSPRANENTNSE
jgi:tRNA pseudouridine13 synthase